MLSGGPIRDQNVCLFTVDHPWPTTWGKGNAISLSIGGA